MFCGGFFIRDAEDVVPYKVRVSKKFVGVGVPDNPWIYGKSQI